MFSIRPVSNVCRLCLQLIKDNNIIEIDTYLFQPENISLKSVLEKFAADLNLELSIQKQLCADCLHCIKLTYDLRSKIDQTEEKIKAYYLKNELLSSDFKIDLSCLIDADEEILNIAGIIDITYQSILNIFDQDKAVKNTPKNGIVTYKCFLCDYNGDNQTEFKTHYEDVHKKIFRYKIQDVSNCTEPQTLIRLNKFMKKPYKCLFKCGYETTNSISTLCNHLCVHTKPYLCAKCSLRFSDPRLLKVHKSKHCDKNIPFSCYFCDYSTLNIIDVRKHYFDKHIILETTDKSSDKSKDNNLTQNENDCPDTSNSSATVSPVKLSEKNNLKVSSKTKVLVNNSPLKEAGESSTIVGEQISVNSSADNRKLHVCEHCPYTTYIYEYLTNHKKLIHSDIANSCSKCKKSFSNELLLKKHLKKHVNECKSKSETIITQTNEDKNESKEISSDEMPILSSVEETETKLNDHSATTQLKLNLMERNYYGCTKCSKTFQLMRSFESHFTEIHKSNKLSIRCTVCNFTTTDKIVIQKHRKSHIYQAKIMINKKSNNNSENDSLRKKLIVNQKASNINRENVTLRKKLIVNQKASNNNRENDTLRKKLIVNEKASNNNRENDKLIVNENTLYYGCTKCTKNFKLMRSLESHFKEFHKLNKLSIRCTVCNFTTSDKVVIQKHRKSHIYQAKISLIKKPNNKEDNDASRNKLIVNENTLLKYRCLKCKKHFSYITQLERHFKELHSKSPLIYSCAICGVNTQKKHTMQSHYELHIKENSTVKNNMITSRKPCKCLYCEKIVSGISNLLQHFKANVNHAQYFGCGICNFKTEHQNKMVEHSNTHHIHYNNIVNNEKPYGCHYCNKKSASIQEIVMHFKLKHSVYKNKQIYVCSICGFKYSRASDLVTHVKNHKINASEQLPENQSDDLHKFNCDSCSYSNSEKRNLISHKMRDHFKPFSCVLCTYRSGVISHLASHIYKIHKCSRNEFMKCFYCNFKCKTRINLREHFKLQHFQDLMTSKISYVSSRNKNTEMSDIKIATQVKVVLMKLDTNVVENLLSSSADESTSVENLNMNACKDSTTVLKNVTDNTQNIEIIETDVPMETNSVAEENVTDNTQNIEIVETDVAMETNPSAEENVIDNTTNITYINTGNNIDIVETDIAVGINSVAEENVTDNTKNIEIVETDVAMETNSSAEENIIDNTANITYINTDNNIDIIETDGTMETNSAAEENLTDNSQNITSKNADNNINIGKIDVTKETNSVEEIDNTNNSVMSCDNEEEAHISQNISIPISFNKNTVPESIRKGTSDETSIEKVAESIESDDFSDFMLHLSESDPEDSFAVDEHVVNSEQQSSAKIIDNKNRLINKAVSAINEIENIENSISDFNATSKEELLTETVIISSKKKETKVVDSSEQESQIKKAETNTPEITITETNLLNQEVGDFTFEKLLDECIETQNENSVQ